VTRRTGYGSTPVFPIKDNIPTLRFPIVTVTFIAMNVAAYFFWQRGGFSLGSPTNEHYLCNLVEYAQIPFEITHPGEQVGTEGCKPPTTPTWVTLFTSMFMHGGLLHLGGNMLFLWIFGNNVEDSMGPLKFIAFYLIGGLAATALQVAIDPDATVPTVGASGAIAGVLGGYLILFPRARVITLVFIVFFVTIIELPAIWILGFWFVEQLLFGYFDLGSQGGEGGVAYFAHIGGFVFGLLAIRLFADQRKQRAQTDRVRY
jgi:membrane associated rhomboid family serine protease